MKDISGSSSNVKKRALAQAGVVRPRLDRSLHIFETFHKLQVRRCCPLPMLRENTHAAKPFATANIREMAVVGI